MDPHVRQRGQHVEHETDGWVRAVTLCFHIALNFMRALPAGCTLTQSDAKQAVQKTLRAICNSPHYIPVNETLRRGADNLRCIAFIVAQEVRREKRNRRKKTVRQRKKKGGNKNIGRKGEERRAGI